MLEQLTKEQESLMISVKDKWINQLYDLKEINVPQLTKGVEWLYSFCKMDKPQILICESILEAQILVNVLKSRDNVRDNVGAKVWDNVWANVWANVRDNGIKVEPTCSCGDINDYGWVSFYDFFTQIGVLKNDNFNEFMSLLESNYYSMIQMDKVCIVIKNPKHILLNEQKQLSSTKDYAIKFNDGWGMYFVNGLYLSDELFNKLSKKEYTSEDFFKEDNEEIKSVCIAFMQQEFGDDYVFNFLRQNLKEINTYVDKKDDALLEGTTRGMNVGVYTLFKGEINNVEISYIRCYCPSTDRMFFLGVDPIHNNAKDAIASLYKIPRKVKPFIKEINRQGERFSTILTNNSILDSLTKEDVNDIVSITGDEYFTLMKYEY